MPKGDVDAFVRYVATLTETKKREREGDEKAPRMGGLAATIVRDFSLPPGQGASEQAGQNKNSKHAKLYRGLVLGSRILEASWCASSSTSQSGDGAVRVRAI